MHSVDAGVPLLDADVDLGADLAADDLAVARRYLRARVHTLEAGPWSPLQGVDRVGHLGLLVLEGVLVRDIAVRGQCCAELIGQGDVLRPWDQEEARDASVVPEFTWEVLQRARVAELDAGLVRLIGRWPAITSRLVERSLRRVRTLGIQSALTQVQGVDVRLHLVLWHLADRWGRVTADGVVLRLPLTHRMLGKLIGARRPSVTSALQRLARDGLVRRVDADTWLLRGRPTEVDLQHESTRRDARLHVAA